MVEKVKVLMLLRCTVSAATAKSEESLAATTEEIKQGKIALPMTLKLNLNYKTKNAAVRGVPNKPANTALIPLIITIVRSFAFNRNIRQRAAAPAPPN